MTYKYKLVLKLIFWGSWFSRSLGVVSVQSQRRACIVKALYTHTELSVCWYSRSCSLLRAQSTNWHSSFSSEHLVCWRAECETEINSWAISICALLVIQLIGRSKEMDYTDIHRNALCWMVRDLIYFIQGLQSR